MQKIAYKFSCASLKGKILAAFIITSVFPSIILLIFSYVNTSGIVRDNAKELMSANLLQIKSSLDVWTASYEDILSQIYMNDDIVDLVGDINQENDNATAAGKLRSILRGMFYTKEYIKCITVITDSGRVVFYDLLTGSVTKTSWMAGIGMRQEEIYDLLSADNQTHLLPTRKAGIYAADTYYLFHMGHRMIDYQKGNKQIGVVLVSIDEAMLREICAGADSRSQFVFLADTNGTVISSADRELLEQDVIVWSEDIEERKQAYRTFLEDSGRIESHTATVEAIFDEKIGADIVNVSSQKELMERLNIQQRTILAVLGVTVLLLFVLIAAMTRNLMSSINRLVNTMKIAEEGKLSVRTVTDEKTPIEIKMIETQFNRMMDKLERSAENEKKANERQRKAEIAALEAQINPHFLYNTLDTINWMAIDKDEYEISNSITSLASILRYGIDNSNAQVEVRRELEWLKQYLFLQQMRLKDTFECGIYAAQETLGRKIHKLLFQPFIENAIVHGFQDRKELHILKVNIDPEAAGIVIRIWDNGKGMSPDLVEMINIGKYPSGRERRSIGMENAITRIQMYYGKSATVKIESGVGEYTSVCIHIPKMSS